MRIAALASLLVAACTGASEDRPPTAPLPEGFRPTGVERDCIDGSAVVERRVLGRAHLLFETAQGAYYRNRLPLACPGLMIEKAFRLRAPRADGQICRADRLEVISAKGPGADCGLGAFERLERRSAAGGVEK